MNDSLDAQFLRRISLLENDFLKLDRSSVDTFTHRWITYFNDFSSAVNVDAKSLGESTITASYTLATRICATFQGFLELEDLSEKLLATHLNVSSSNTAGTPPPQTSESTAFPAYIKPAYDWLLDNLHDPYPSTCIRDNIAQKSGSNRKDVDNWFIDARKRIGWNTLRKTSFSNKRVDIVDAATRFFVQDDPKRPLDTTIEYELIAIKKCAKDLYIDKFSETVLATKLDVAVKTLTPQTKAEAKAEQLRRLQLQKDRQSYPSPERSPEPTRLSPFPHDDEDSVSASQSISATSRKRSLSSEPQESHDDSSGDRPMKRTRLDTPNLNLASETFPVGLPSPAHSVDEPLQGVVEAVSNPITSSAHVVAPAPSRKRRLSDSDGQGLPKRPRNLPVGPRVQAVSDPLPLSSALFDVSAFDGWFQQHFDLHDSALHVGEISPSHFDIELGNLPDFEHDSQSGSSNASPLMTPQTFDLPTLEVSSGLTELPPTQLPTEFNFDLATMLSNELLSDQVTPTAQDFSVPEIPSMGLDLFTDFSAATGAVNLAMTTNSSFNCQWDSFNFLDMGPQVINTGSIQNGLSFLPSTSGDFMMPPGHYCTTSQADVRAEKEAKLRQMKEEALRLELELAAS